MGVTLLFAPHLCEAQTQQMPPIDAKTLSGDLVKLPEMRTNKPVVLVFGFAHSARGQGEIWGRRLVEMQAKQNDFNLYQVATLSGAPRFTHGLITRAIRANVPAAYHQHILLLTENDRVWRDLLGVTDDQFAYVVLCNSFGEIQWVTRGVGKAQFEGLRTQLQKALTN